MNPYTWIIAHTVARALTRVCPHCGHPQTVPREKLRDSIPCERCGAAVPPPARGGPR